MGGELIQHLQINMTIRINSNFAVDFVIFLTRLVSKQWLSWQSIRVFCSHHEITGSNTSHENGYLGLFILTMVQCETIGLSSISITQHQHNAALALHSISIAQHQHCVALALRSTSIAQQQHCVAVALLSSSIAQQ